jgi:lysophospholipase L1-like esterase
MRKILFLLFTAATILVACKEKDDPVISSGLEIKGSVDYTGAMVPVADGVWDVYGRFKSGQVTVSDAGGREFVSFQVPTQKEGLCRLRVKSDRTYSLVRIDKISLVVTEGGVDKPRVGSKPPIEAVYRGGGVWGVTRLLIATDHMRYRFLLETDTPGELRYLCPAWNDAGLQPSSYSDDYLKVRSLGQDEYVALGIKDNFACWMFPASETDRMASFTLPMNKAATQLEVAFSTSHLGPRALFMGDSIIRHWGSESPREIEKSAIVIPMDPLPSWMRDDGDFVTVFWHPEFFTDNNYLSAGISGNNTTQMLARYRSEALTPDPQCIVIMGGTNDLSNGQPEALIFDNIRNMTEQAEALGIKVILCSVTPCNHNHSALSNPQTKGAHINELNRLIREYAESKGIIYCDFHSLLVDTDSVSLQGRYRLYDDLHPNPDAYTLMEREIKPLIDSITE